MRRSAVFEFIAEGQRIVLEIHFIDALALSSILITAAE